MNSRTLDKNQLSDARNHTDFLLELTANNNSNDFAKNIDDFYQNFKPTSKSANDEPINSLDDLLKHNLMVGEIHNEIAAKNLLINNMALLKAHGYDTFFVEGLCYDYQHPSANISNEAVNILQKVDNIHQLNDDNVKNANNYTALVNAAKSHGIRVIGLESQFALNHSMALGTDTVDGEVFRLKSFNFIADQIIKHTTHQDNGRWFLLAGSLHLKTVHGIPGLADLNRAKTIVVTDKNKSLKYPEIYFNQDCESLNNETFKTDVSIDLDTTMEAPLFSKKIMDEQEIENAAVIYRNFTKALTVNDTLPMFVEVINEFYIMQTPYLKSSNKPVKSLTNFLDNNIVIGEQHTEISAKNFLIKNMRLLKYHGFDKLYLEGVNHADQAKLDSYTPNANNQINSAINRIHLLNEENNLENDLRKEENNYMALITAAKKVGIRVVGIDTDFTISSVSSSFFKSQEEKANYRLKSLNYTAYQIINNEPKKEHKWIALVGNLHIKAVNGIPGIADLTQARAITIEDCKNISNPYNEITFDHKYKSVAGCDITVDAKIINNPADDIPLITDISSQMTDKHVKDIINNYNKYKNQFFGARFFKMSDATKKVINDLKLAKNDEERFELANDYLKKNQDKAFANEIRNIVWPSKN